MRNAFEVTPSAFRWSLHQSRPESPLSWTNSDVPCSNPTLIQWRKRVCSTLAASSSRGRWCLHYDNHRTTKLLCKCSHSCFCLLICEIITLQKSNHCAQIRDVLYRSLVTKGHRLWTFMLSQRSPLWPLMVSLYLLASLPTSKWLYSADLVTPSQVVTWNRARTPPFVSSWIFSNPGNR